MQLPFVKKFYQGSPFNKISGAFHTFQKGTNLGYKVAQAASDIAQIMGA